MAISVTSLISFDETAGAASPLEVGIGWKFAD